jgi:digeranylgeranylglycerophospholipid reductase
MKEEIQIAVVGAGPAGSTAAEAAAAQGAKVALIDRKEEIGTPVQCGGFLPETHELQGLMPRAHLPSVLAEIPERCILHKTKLQRVYAPSGKAKEFSVAGRVLDRRAFDHHLAYRAARAGARVLPATRAALVNGELRLTGRFSGSMMPQVIIGADGPLSGIARSIGTPAGELGICLEYEMADVQIDDKAAEMYFSARFAPGGYAWIIPLGSDTANVGVGVRSSYLGRSSLPRVLDRFVQEHPVASEKLRHGEVLAVMRGAVPAGGSPGEIQHENILLAGDAAGHVMATSGGGIPLAVVAGRVAGEIAAAHIKGEAALQEYQSRIYNEFGRELERSVQIRKMVDVIMRSDRLIDALFGALSPDQMKSIMRAQIPPALNMVHELVAGSR